MKYLELKLTPPILFPLFAGAMYLISLISMGKPLALPYENRLMVGVSLLTIGMVISAAGIRQFLKVKTTIDPRQPSKASHLVTGGIYKVTRNPMYLGQVVIMTGWGLYLASIYSFVLVPVFAIYLNRFQIVPEERILTEKFGQDYTAYQQRVRRWL